MSDEADIVDEDDPKAQFLKKFLDLLQDKVANPESYSESKITIGELRFLEKHRPQLFVRPEVVKPSNDDICEGQAALAIRLTQHYTNPDGTNRLSFKITKGHISNWCLLKAPEAAKNHPPGQMEGSTYRFSLSAWIEWIDAYVLPFKRAGGAGIKSPMMDDEEDQVAMEQQEKKDVIRHKRFLRDVEKNKYVLREVARATVIAAVKKVHLAVKQEDERGHTKQRREKLMEIGVAPELIEKFCAWDNEMSRQTTDRREGMMEEWAI